MRAQPVHITFGFPGYQVIPKPEATVVEKAYEPTSPPTRHAQQENSTGSRTGPINDAWLDALRTDILDHLAAIGLPSLNANDSDREATRSKEAIRAIHSHQRQRFIGREKAALGHRWGQLLQHFANGNEVVPSAIEPELVPVEAGRETGNLFRFATLLWSVPVSAGYGRRMRYLVRDRSNGKLIGIFALGDPVFNLQARDRWIGWDANDRRARLVHVMDAYVVGAVPPYSDLLSGKLVASLIGSAEVGRDFSMRYGRRKGVISGEEKGARLVLVTVCSALGRSSLYNRLKLAQRRPDATHNRPLVELSRIGETKGYGHFHLSDGIFDRLRELVAAENHPYASAHEFGQGPNWRWRVIRVGLERLGLDGELLRHGIVREIYAMPLAPNFREFLRGDVDEPDLDRPTVAQIAAAALNRWVLPRAKRRPDYQRFRREEALERMGISRAELS